VLTFTKNTIMKSLSLFLLSFILAISCFAQSNPDDISGIFASRDDKDMKLYDGFNVQDYNYYYNADTLFYQFYGKEMALPLSLVDFKTAKIEEEKKWMTIGKEKIYYLKLKPVKNRHFPTQYDFKFATAGTDEVTFYFISKEMAENALEFLKDPHPLQSNAVAADDDKDDYLTMILAAASKHNDEGIDKILAKKDDADFELTLGNGSSNPMKYFLYNDSLWFSGTELYAVVIPFDNIDIAKIFTYESGVWKNKNGSKCYEIPVYAKTGKRFSQDFRSLWGADSPMEKQLGGKEITITGLVVPDKEWADKFIAYIKAKANE
jgi:hypothetical protein